MTKNSVSIETNNITTADGTYAQTKKEYITFAALKLIEELYHQGKIKKHIYENILKDNAKIVDITQFALAS